MTNLILHCEDIEETKIDFKQTFLNESIYQLQPYTFSLSLDKNLDSTIKLIILNYNVDSRINIIKYLKTNNIKILLIIYNGNTDAYIKIKKLGLDKNIIFWSNECILAKTILSMLKNLKINGFTK